MEIKDQNEKSPQDKHLNEDINKLNIDDFELNYDTNKNTQALFYFALTKCIDIYNEDKTKSKDMGIYVIKDRKVMMTSITEEIVDQFIDAKILLKDLISGKTRFYSEYNSDHKTNSKKNYKNGNRSCNFNLNNKITKKGTKSVSSQSNNSNISNKSQPVYMSHKNIEKESLQSEEEKENLKIEYNLKHMSYYFNGLYFEELGTKIIFDLIEQDTTLLPRMIFYMKQNKNEINNKINPDFHGYNELDLAFIPIQKDIEIKEDRITCFKNFAEKTVNFYKENNYEKLIIKKNEVIIIEFKSRWESLKDLDYKNRNKLEVFLKKALEFITYYKSLNLIQKEQSIVLIYLYNNNMTYNYKEENQIIENEYKKIKGETNLRLYIGFMQPYIKIMSIYKQEKKLRNLENDVENLKNKNKNLEEQFEIQKAKNIKLEEEIENLKKMFHKDNNQTEENEEKKTIEKK